MPQATKSKKKVTGKSRKSRTNPIDPKLARYAELIHDALTHREDADHLESIRKKVVELNRRFPLP